MTEKNLSDGQKDEKTNEVKKVKSVKKVRFSLNDEIMNPKKSKTNLGTGVIKLFSTKIKKSIPRIFSKSIDSTASIDSSSSESESNLGGENKLIGKMDSIGKSITKESKSSEKVEKKANDRIQLTMDPMIKYFEFGLNEEQKYDLLFKKYKRMICNRNNYCETYSIDNLNDFTDLENNFTNIRTIATFYLNNIGWFIQLKRTGDASNNNKLYLGIYLYAGDTDPFIVDWFCRTIGKVSVNCLNDQNSTEKKEKSLDKMNYEKKMNKFKSFSHVFKRNTGFQIPNFIEIKDLSDLIQNNQFQITFELTTEKPIIDFSKDIYYVLNQTYFTDKDSEPNKMTKNLTD